ncbi:MAG: hypothetical protein LBT51_09595 [Fusobacteriaceae bacterium]|nr:hypothetical protein [Fusobacteriaceae bacterium]
MFKLLSIKNYMMTRNIQLKNLETGTIEDCFDDSDLSDLNNFQFMEIGKNYECKILLFGECVEKKSDENYVICKVNSMIKIGIYWLLEVSVNNEVYYVSKNNVKNDEKIIYYSFTRKDIIQVNDIVHWVMLEDL